MKNIQELEEALLVKQGIAPGVHGAGTINGAGIDSKDFDSMLIALDIGTILATGTLNVKLQESSDNGVADAFTDIVGAVFPERLSTTDEAIIVARIKTKNFQRFIRAVGVVATAAGDWSVTHTLGKFDGLAKVTQDITPAFTIDYISDGGTVGSPAT